MTEFLQLVFAGLALGARYALVALGFVIIYRATGVINFAQGGLVAIGAYLTYAFANGAGLPFVLAVIARRRVPPALVGAAIERTVLRHMVGQPVVRGDHGHDRPAVHHRAGRHGDLGLRRAQPRRPVGRATTSRPAAS